MSTWQAVSPWLGYAGIGGMAGLFAGMLGVGGGLLIIPLLALSFDAQGLPHGHMFQLAVGTAMASIAFTSISSTQAHARRRAVRWDIARSMTPGILLGSVAGANVAVLLPTRVLMIYFAAFVLLMSLQMAFGRLPRERAPPADGREQRDSALGMFGAGFVISALCSLLAMGGAMMTVPFMLHRRVPLVHAIGTAAAIGLPIALGGTAGYVLTGWSVSELPRLSVGYVYVPALLGIVAASVLTAPVGAAIAHRAPPRVLRGTFALLLFALALKMAYTLW
ncbi:MAG: sulfite exporter TauE/SafE family protein [Burkholderiales bacterium]|nr:sulfite exporter TauE/SafE family protein [Burkholderiales bacterium]